MAKTINEWSKEIYETAKSKGWHDESRSFGEIVALCHCELSEAMEEYRNHKPMIYFNDGENINEDIEILALNGAKPEGIAVEILDCILRCFDFLGSQNIDVEKIMEIKHNYNKNRSYRHGGKKI